MRKLARATKKGLATYYNYFASKEEVLFELQRQAFTTLIRAAGEALASVEEPAERLRIFISSHIRYLMAHPDIMQIQVHEAATLPPKWRKEVRILKEQYFRIGREVVRQLEPLGRHAEPVLDDLVVRDLGAAGLRLLLGLLRRLVRVAVPLPGVAAGVALLRNGRPLGR